MNTIFAGVTYCANGRYPSEELDDYALDFSDSRTVHESLFFSSDELFLLIFLELIKEQNFSTI